MSGTTAIQWARNRDGSAGRTWNPLTGCSLKSPGCHNCYAMPMAFRLRAMALADIAAGRDPGRKRYYINAVDDSGRWTGTLTPIEEALRDPLTWRKPTTIFVNSMTDLFHESVPVTFIDGVFATMAICRRHTFQVLTKRSERLVEYFDAELDELWQRWAIAAGNLLDGEWIWNEGKRYRPQIERFMSCGMGEALDDEKELTPNELAMIDALPPNVWLGVSVEDRKRKSRIDDLRQVPAAVRFLSCEPLLEDLGELDLTDIHQVIIGGESGADSRRCDIDWLRSIINQCRGAGVACFVKQLGAQVTVRNDDIADWFEDCGHLDMGPTERFQGAIGRVLGLRDKKGGDPAEWPEDLRMREMPE